MIQDEPARQPSLNSSKNSNSKSESLIYSVPKNVTTSRKQQNIERPIIDDDDSVFKEESINRGPAFNNVKNKSNRNYTPTPPINESLSDGGDPYERVNNFTEIRRQQQKNQNEASV